MPAFTSRDRLTSTGIERLCCRCGIWQDLNGDNFYSDARRPQGFGAACRACGRRSRREARETGTAGTRNARKFGVEMEFVGANFSTVVAEMTRRGLSCSAPGYTHRVMRSWKVVSDASVTGGGELVSPPLSGADGQRQLKLACEALAAAGARVNRACGLHVHHDVSELNVQQLGRLFRNWSDTQSATDQMVAASRRNSRWAAPLTDRDVRHIEALRNTDRYTVQSHFSYVDRYRSLNVAAYPRYGTVEVRQHQGSINYSKIAAWVAYGQAQIRAAVAGATLASVSAHDLIDSLAAHGLTAAQVRDLKARATHFGFAPATASVA
jgi:hypothetical protein